LASKKQTSKKAAHQVVLLLGSNKGNKSGYIKKAIGQIKIHVGSLEAVSSMYSTEAWGLQETSSFVNLCCHITTDLAPGILMQRCLDIEKRLGRKRRVSSPDREIDIDILFYDDAIIRQKKCIIPHPRLHLRNFAMIPLLEILPDMVHPEFGLKIEEMLKLSTDKLKVKKIEAPSFAK